MLSVQLIIYDSTYCQGVQSFCLLHFEVVWWDVSALGCLFEGGGEAWTDVCCFG